MVITLNNNLSTMKVGEYVWCKYTATSGVVGTFSDFATKTDAEVVSQEIPVASTATPNGYFKFIMVEDWNGKKRLVADRNIQHSISWDTLNTAGIASGSGLPLTSISEEPTIENGFYRKLYTIRLLNGGISDTDKDNEWDKYIVSSNLGGAITTGDNTVWNWNVTGVYSWTSTTENRISSANRVRRGGQDDINKWNSADSSYLGTFGGFRPILEEYVSEFVELNKTLILHNDEYKKYGETVEGFIIGDLLPIPFTSNVLNGITISASSQDSSYQEWKAFDKNKNTQWIASNSSTSPQHITVDFVTPRKVTNVIINEYNSRIGSFEIQYSDNGTTFTNVRSIILEDHTTRIDKEFPIEVESKHRYWRIFITSNYAGNTLGIASLTFEGEIEKITKTWQTVSSTLPTVNQFIDEGMDSLTPLLDRVVQNLNPQEMELDSTFVGEGKLYRKKVDLNKYFDLRTITTETRNS